MWGNSWTWEVPLEEEKYQVSKLFPSLARLFAHSYSWGTLKKEFGCDSFHIWQPPRWNSIPALCATAPTAKPSTLLHSDGCVWNEHRTSSWQHCFGCFLSAKGAETSGYSTLTSPHVVTLPVPGTRTFCYQRPGSSINGWCLLLWGQEWPPGSSCAGWLQAARTASEHECCSHLPGRLRQRVCLAVTFHHVCWNMPQPGITPHRGFCK